MVLRVGWYIRTTRWRSSPRGNMLNVILFLAGRGIAIPGAPLMTSALTTSFCGIDAISDGSLVAVGAGGVASVERARTVNGERRRAGLARASEQARRRDIGLVKTLENPRLPAWLVRQRAPYFGKYISRLTSGSNLTPIITLAHNVVQYIHDGILKCSTKTKGPFRKKWE